MNFDEIKDLILERRSIRRFRDESIDEKALIELIDIAKWAPSAGNLQSWDIILINDKNVMKELVKAALNQHFISEASYVLVICANLPRTARIYGQRGATLYAYQDTAAFIQNLLLLIHSKGWGAVWIGAFREKAVAEILKVELESGLRPVAIIPVGIPDETPKGPKRLPLTEILHINLFGNLFKK